ncbi:DNA polymerase III alpha subunit [Pseudomonas synxantha]|nr:DNA polymerase III alpha subunit [Pseudomonas synxantha]
MLFCRSELAREKPENAAFFLASRVIVNDLREQARTHRVRARFNDQVGYKAASLCF